MNCPAKAFPIIDFVPANKEKYGRNSDHKEGYNTYKNNCTMDLIPDRHLPKSPQFMNPKP